MRLWPVRRRAPQPEAPREDDLIAYARAHVTSPGAHALLDEVERGRQRRESTRAHLPADLTETAISAMDFGRTYYTVPWAMWSDTEGRLWLHPDYTTATAPQGTMAMRLELHADGYHAWPVKGHAYRPKANPGYCGSPSQPFIPVAAIEGAQ